jgi:xylose isomerase
MALTKYRFSFGPWNIHSGADAFGPPVRREYSFDQKLEFYKKLGFDGVQFHDNDVVDAEASYTIMVKTAKKVKKLLDDRGLEAEFIAPRLWEDRRTIDGGLTANNPKDRQYALDRSKRSVDIANILGTKKIVLWPAREGTYIRESKDPKLSTQRIVEYLNSLLNYDSEIIILGEMKPNEPMDQAYCPTTGHFIGLAYKTIDPDRVGALIESAHCILAGLDPSDEMGYALWHNKLWGVHLNDQNGLKFDEDKTFGSVSIRRAFNQVYVLEKNGYGRNGEFIGLDVKAMRTQMWENSVKHLKNCREMFLGLLKIVRNMDEKKRQNYINNRDYEGLEMFILENLLK